MKYIHTFDDFLNEGMNRTKVKITNVPSWAPPKILLQKFCLLRTAEKPGDIEVVNNTQLGRLRDREVGFEILKESLDDEKSKEDIVFFPGRFQPFHTGHLSAAKKTAEAFGKPVVVLQIVSDRKESPFSEDLLKKMGKDVARSNSFIKDFLIYPRGYGKTVVPQMVRYLREMGYEPYGLGAGADRMKDYQKQIEYINSDRSDTRVDPSFAVNLVDIRAAQGPSGEKVRQALKDGDRFTFDSLMPKELHKHYDEMKNQIQK